MRAWPILLAVGFSCSVGAPIGRGETGETSPARAEVEIEEIDAVRLAKLVKNESDEVVLVNVWATWCAPCVTELPELVSLQEKYKDREFRLVTISMDDPEMKADALRVLQERKVTATNYLSAIGDLDEFASALDREWKGPVPYTILIAPGGKIVYRQNNSIELPKVREAIEGALRTRDSRSTQKSVGLVPHTEGVRR